MNLKEYFSIRQYFIYIQNFFNLSFDSKRLEKISKREFIHNSFYWWSSSLGFFVLVQLIFAVGRLDFLNQYREILAGMVDAKLLSHWYFWMNAFPFDIIFISIVSIFILTWEALWSLLSAKIFRLQSSFLDIFGLVAYANVYLNLSFVFVFVFYRIAPEWIQSDTFGMAVFIGLNLLCLVTGYLLHLYSFVRIGRKMLYSNSLKIGAIIAAPQFLFVLLVLWGR